MVLQTVKNLLCVKIILKKLSCSGVNNHIEMCKGNVLEKNIERTRIRMKRDKAILK